MCESFFIFSIAFFSIIIIILCVFLVFMQIKKNRIKIEGKKENIEFINCFTPGYLSAEIIIKI